MHYTAANVLEAWGGQMSLAVAIEEMLKIRGWTRSQLIAHLPEPKSRWSVYRLLQGRSQEVLAPTLIDLCTALDTSPSELLQMGGLVRTIEPSAGRFDDRLRRALAPVQSLSPETKAVAIESIEAVVAVLQRWDAMGRAVEKVSAASG